MGFGFLLPIAFTLSTKPAKDNPAVKNKLSVLIAKEMIT